MSFLQDLRVAGRALYQRPGWTAATVGTLAIGLAGAIAVGSVVDGVLLRPLPYARSDRIVRLYEADANGHRMRFADPNFLDLAAVKDVFPALAEYESGPTPVLLAGAPERLDVAVVSRDFFAVFGVQPRFGRLFASDETTAGGRAAALVSERTWRERFGATTDLASIRVASGGVAYAVVGVLPASFDFPPGTSLWTARERDPFLPSRTAHNFWVAGRLADGMPLDAARGRANEVAARLARELGDRIDMRSVAILPLLDSLVAGIRPALLLEATAAAFLLLVAGANAAALALARLESRRREIATRLALGARASELARFFFAEAAWLAAGAGLVGLLLAAWSVAAWRTLAGAAVPRLDAVRIDGRVALLALALVVAVAAALAVVATLAARRIDVEAALRAGAPGGGGGRRRLRAVAVATQAAIAAVLLVGVALLGTSLARLLAVAPGFHPEGRIAVDLFPTDPVEQPAEKARRAAAISTLLDDAGRLPGVRAAGVVSALPLVGDSPDGTVVELTGESAPRTIADFENLMHTGAPHAQALYVVASEGYFRALAVPLLAGRLFLASDTGDAPHVAVVSKALAARMWPDENPLGRRLEFGNMDGDTRPLTVVGVVGDVRQESLAAPVAPIVYTCFRQRPQGAPQLSFVVAAGASGATLAAPLREAARAAFPEAPSRLRALDSLVAEATAARRLVLELLALFGGAALALAGAGVFGAVSLAVGERQRDYGIRMALGADARRVLGLALVAGLRPVVIGVAAGATGAALASRWLASQLYEIRPTHAPAYLAAALAIVAVATAAALLPARRAASIDPARALRAE